MICVVQVDLKRLIAYSSIRHIGFVLVGIFSGSAVGWSGSIMIIIGHGVRRPLLFALANYTYKLFHSRNIILCKGVLLMYPHIGGLWFARCVLRMGLPPGVLFFSEVFFLMGVFSTSWVLLIPIRITCFASAVFSLFLYSRVRHGGTSKLILRRRDRVSSFSFSFIGVGLYLVMGLRFIIEYFV